MESAVSRRAFITRGVLGGVSAAGLTAAEAYSARYRKPYRPRLERTTLSVPRGHESLAGLRIGFISDTHVGPFIAKPDVERAADLIRAEKPDLLLLGGDYVSESTRYIPIAVDALGSLGAEIELGAVGVLGNHDLHVNGYMISQALNSVGITILRNESHKITYNGEDLWIAGIDETLLGYPDVNETFAGIPAGAASIALWHEPEFAEQAAAKGAFAQLSGHTHGGQIRIPGVGPVGLPIDGKRYVMGHNVADGMQIYTSRGVGVFRPPMRFNCPPEVTIITLVASS
jgi:predicted MPP superfamily phosphohydrolase